MTPRCPRCSIFKCEDCRRRTSNRKRWDRKKLERERERRQLKMLVPSGLDLH